MINLADLGEKEDIHEAYLEVKNLRAPRGIVDVFNDLYHQLSAMYPALLGYRILLTYYCDNTVTDEQSSCIEEFLVSLGNSAALHTTTLPLPGGIEVKIKLTESPSGGVNLMRPIGGSYPDGPFTDTQAFLKKATLTIRKAVQQLSQYTDATRILALNIQTPDAIFSSDIGFELRKLVEQESSGTVDCILFHHHSIV